VKILITGGTGFIGLRLARAIAGRTALTAPDGTHTGVDEIVLFDQTVPSDVAPLEQEGFRVVAGDISDRDTVFELIDCDDMSVFHLASVVSGGGEKDFDLAMRVNLDGGRHIAEALRARSGLQRLVFASSIAVFGGDGMPPSVGDDTKQTPLTTYGVTKAIGELLINDYTRKGFLDGRSARLPTVIIRPGKPNAAASSFVSAVFREPLNGEDYVLPVRIDTAMPVLGYRAIVEGILNLHELSGERLGADRAVSLPAFNVTVKEMIDALHRVAGERQLGRITVSPDPFIAAIVQTWPRVTHDHRARDLGLPVESSLDEIVRYYIDDYLS
jgi:nucleoside-diphosphate-sugar epimerase